MKDELISFETAKIVKEKGFNVPTYDYFMGSKKSYTYSTKSNHNNLDYNKEMYSRPNQSLLQKWLREVHGILLWIIPEEGLDRVHWSFRIGYTEDGMSYFTYEEALEAGLQEALKIIS